MYMLALSRIVYYGPVYFGTMVQLFKLLHHFNVINLSLIIFSSNSFLYTKIEQIISKYKEKKICTQSLIYKNLINERVVVKL